MTSLAESATANTTDSDSPPVIVVVLGALIAFGLYMSHRSKEKDAAAAAHLRAMDEKERLAKERAILAALDHDDLSVATLRNVVNEDDRVTQLLIGRLLRFHEVEILPDQSQPVSDGDSEVVQEPTLSWSSTLTLTRNGAARLREMPPEVKVMQGDYIFADNGSTVTNRSFVSNSFNDYSAKYGADITEALQGLEVLVRKSGTAEDV